eukprot:CAMPEP_0175141068 /NCGR_PEP_ID=MMETSP0087-20121206/11878_1 /TAXON_ID=136419 /ORGANISM="Unknown Unknown, Strain D1" /LENGTH=397 /DNA_ID=CAMNT_0016424399 /DNA_START=24 /DNA_END=1217 /DNA_ORIENTATION=-
MMNYTLIEDEPPRSAFSPDGAKTCPTCGTKCSGRFCAVDGTPLDRVSASADSKDCQVGSGEESKQFHPQRAPLMRFYQERNPANMWRVEKLLKDFEGRYDEMWMMLEKKYPMKVKAVANLAPAAATQPIFDVWAFADPISKETAKSLPRLMGDEISGKTITAASGLQASAKQFIGTVQENIAFSDLSVSMLLDKEVILLGGQSLGYSSAIFSAPDGRQLRVLPVGALMLTTQRLLFVRADCWRAVNVTQSGNAEAGNVLVSLNMGDMCGFFPLKVAHTRHAEFDSLVHFAGTSQVNRGTSCCNCCPSTTVRNKTSAQSSNRTVSLGALLPPWQEKTVLTIQMQPSTSIRKIRDFVKQLQDLQHDLGPIAQPPLQSAGSVVDTPPAAATASASAPSAP